MTAPSTSFRGYGPHNAGQVEAERAHADGEMRSARRARARLDSGELSALLRVVVGECVASAHCYRRAARDASHGRIGGPS